MGDAPVVDDNPVVNPVVDNPAVEHYECRTYGKILKHQPSKSRHEKRCKKKCVNPLVVKKSYSCSNVWCDKVFNKISNFKRHSLTCQRKIKAILLH